MMKKGSRWLVLLLWLFSSWTLAEEKMGVVLMHGKQGGGSRDGSLNALQLKLEAAGMVVLRPEMPWSFNKYIEGDWNLAMAEIRSHVQKLRDQGVTRIALMGHSLGSPAALSFAVRHPGQVQALGLLAPGHVPLYYSECIPFSPIKLCGVKEGVERARKEVESGRGDQRIPHTDINQGRTQTLWMTSKDYLSYFEPASDAEMAVTAPRLPDPLPVLWVIGDRDYLIRMGRGYVFDKLPAHPKNLYLEVSANHITTPGVAADQIVSWLQDALKP